MEQRLASSVLVSALLRRAQDEGGFGAVLAKGDPTAGAIAVILAEQGVRACLLERLLQPDGRYAWEESAQERGERGGLSRPARTAAEKRPGSVDRGAGHRVRRTVRR